MAPETRRYVALDSWRGLCALLVALFHFPVAGALRDSLLARNAWIFVDFFFVLSGFVIAKSYGARLGDADAIGRFILKRFGRLWPLHALVLVLFVAQAWATGGLGVDEEHSVSAIFTNLAMVQAWGIHHIDTWNFPSWSISVEWFLYLVFALTAQAPGRTWIFLGLIALSMATLAWVAPHGVQSSYDFGVFRGMAGFFMGVLLTRAPLRPFGTLAEILVVGVVVAFVALGRGLLAGSLIFAATVYVFAGSQGLISRLLTWRPVAALGALSYSIYMLHVAVISVMWAFAAPLGLHRSGGLLIPERWGDLYALGFLALTVAISSQSYRWFEHPTTEYFKRLATRRLAAPVPQEP